MTHYMRTLSSQAGHALAGVVILVFVMAILGAGFMSLAGYETRSTQQDLESQRAFWLAEAGKVRALRWMNHQTRPPENDVNIYQDATGPDGGTYTVECLVDTTSLYEVEKSFVLDCTGHSGNRDRRIRQRIRMTSFAQYAYFTDDELSAGGFPIWFVSTDAIEGPLHTNGTLRVLGSPRFLGEVTSASDHMLGYPNYWVDSPSDWPVGVNNPLFAEGFELNMPQVPLPTQTLDLRQEALTGGVYIGAQADLELGVTGPVNPVPAPGWFRYRPTDPPGGNWTSVQITTLPGRVFYADGDLHVKGLLDGELTVASSLNVRIEDNLTYQASDAQGAPLPGCDDLLGVVAGGNIVFVDNIPNGTDLLIDGVLMGLNTSITAENYGTRGYCGALTIWGGLIQKYRGAVGITNGNIVTHGYRKDYHYDTRVTARTPPAFPLTGVYNEVAWTETWDASYPF
jgi:hypothetical protein